MQGEFSIVFVIFLPESTHNLNLSVRKHQITLNRGVFYKITWLEKTPESPLDSKEIQPIHPKGDQSWVFIGRTDVEAETPVLWPPDAKSWLIWKDPDGGKGWGQEEKGTTEDEMFGWNHQLNGHGFWWTPGVGDGPGGLVCCSSRGHKELDTSERLNWIVYKNVLVLKAKEGLVELFWIERDWSVLKT